MDPVSLIFEQVHFSFILGKMSVSYSMDVILGPSTIATKMWANLDQKWASYDLFKIHSVLKMNSFISLVHSVHSGQNER